MSEKRMWNSFLLNMLVEILQLAYEISSFWEVFFKKGVLKNFSKVTAKHKKQPSRSVSQNSQKKIFAGVFFNKVADWKPETFLNKRPVRLQKSD